MDFLGGATILDSFLRACKTSKTKRFFTYEWFDHPDNLQNTDLPAYDTFYSKLRSCDLFEAEYNDCLDLMKSGLTTDQAVIRLRNYQCHRLQELRTINSCQRFGSRIV